MAKCFEYIALIACWTVCQCQELSGNIQMPNIHRRLAPEDSNPGSRIPSVMSVVVGGDLDLLDFVKIINPPDIVKHGTVLRIEYRCVDPDVVGVQLKVLTFSGREVIVFHRWWQCGGTREPLVQSMKVRLQDKLAYRPSHFNKVSISVKSVDILVWIVDDPALDYPKIDIFSQSATKSSHEVAFPHPFDRLGKPTTICLSWWMQQKMNKPYTPVCTEEQEVFNAITFPVALSGHYNGVHRFISDYTDPTLRRKRRELFHNPKQTISLWLYIVEYCTEGRILCSIIQRLTWNERYCTPLVYITNKGRLHLQAVSAEGKTQAFLTSPSFTIPKLQWCHLVISIDGRMWMITKNCEGEHYINSQVNKAYVQFPWPVYYDATMSLTIVGGSEIAASFKGYVGEAKIYRNRLMSYSEIPKKSPYDHIFELGLSEWNTKCSRYLSWVHHVEYRAKRVLEQIIKRKQCHSEVYNLFYPDVHDDTLTCDMYTGPIPKQYLAAYRTLRHWVVRGHRYTQLDISKELMKNVTHVLEESGLLGIQSVMPLLRQASCYGNHDATFMLATILNNGMGVKADENQAHKYLMYGALEGNVLCQLALGNKHMYGLDGVTQDYEQAYAYYKTVAVKTKLDRENHAHDGLFTEHVRLTDEEMIQAMTDEEGDVFHWLKHQSEQGVLSAQQEMARMLYWGARGVTRDTDAAVNYYKMGAEAEDPVSQYDYGIILLKGHGVEANITAAIELFEKSAAHGYHPAYNVLGWYYLEHKGDYEKARDYLEKAFAQRNADAAHNLGYMRISGRYPGKGVDRIGALKYYAFGAKLGQMDSGIMVAQYNIRGGVPEIPRNVPLATDWVRFVAEQNIALGMILRRGLKAYNHQNWPAALVYYHMAAETGLETGTFNTAYLCDENDEGLVHYLEKECTWRFFNQSIQRELHQVNAYSLIKMGDYFWYGCKGGQDATKASHYYTLAAKKGDPHALFNLGFMIEEGAKIPNHMLQRINIKPSNNTRDSLVQIYSKCMEATNTEAYMPCSLSLYRVQAMHLWNTYSKQVQLLSIVGGMLLFVMAAMWLSSQYKSRQQAVSNV